VKRVALHLLICVLAAACGQDAAPSLAPAELYEDDDPILSGKADSLDLYAVHAIGTYEVALQELRITESVTTLMPADGELAAGARVRVFRQLILDETPASLVVDLDDLDVAVVERASLESRAEPLGDESTPYADALVAMRGDAYETLTLPAEEGAERFAVTIDMCQSSREWESELFDWLRDYAATRDDPVPVGIAMTGLWALRHPEQFREIVRWHADGELSIVWIDHSFHHPLRPNADRSVYAFMTAEDVDMRDEVTDLERLLLSQGALPSTLFRFPGLTWNETRLADINDMSLVALDADAWIAKGQPVKDAGVVLLHGNGNEPIGVDWFLEQMEEREAALMSGTSRLVDPRLVVGR